MSELVNQLTRRGVIHETAAPTLEMANVSVSYPAAGNLKPGGSAPPLALENISIRIRQGERIAVVGPNGAGKSTLFKLIVGTLKPTRGRVHVFGHDPGGHICIAYVPQRSQIDWTFPVTVKDVVMMGRVGQIGLFRWPGQHDWDLVWHSLDRVGATAWADQQIGALSGGQQQRVFIARALAQEAELLLLDEPLAGLDVPSREAIFDILDTLRPDNVTVLLATHDLDLAARHFDRVMLLNRWLVAFDQPESALKTANLLQAYGGHLHLVDTEQTMIVADGCCGDHE